MTLLLFFTVCLLSCQAGDLEDVEAGDGAWSEDVEVLNRTERLLVEDKVWTSMVRLAWEDYIARINRDREVYGVVLDPLRMASMVDTSLNLSQSLLGYQVDLSMWDLSLYGLSDLVMEDLKVMRSPGLNDVNFKMELEIPQLVLTGLYQMEAVSWLLTGLSSEGRQELVITITNVTITVQTEVLLGRGCGQEGALVREGFKGKF